MNDDLKDVSEVIENRLNAESFPYALSNESSDTHLVKLEDAIKVVRDTLSPREQAVPSVVCNVPLDDLNAVHELLSNYIEYWLGGSSEDKRRERNKWKPINERVWRAAHGFGYTNHPKTLEELEE